MPFMTLNECYPVKCVAFIWDPDQKFDIKGMEMPFMTLNERYPVKCAAFIRDPDQMLLVL